MFKIRSWRIVACLAVIISTANAQMTITSTLTGTVMDPSRQVIPGATVTLVSEKTRESRTATTNEQGAFMFPAIPPDTYSLKIEHGGFKVLQRTGLNLSANERLSLGDVVLTIGAVTETVSVTGQATVVQTDSSEHSAALTSTQLETLTTRGREVVSLLRTIPGVQYQADQDSVGGSFGTGTPNIGGAFSGTNILAVDGVVSNDMGSPNVFSSVTTLDAIGEVKVILNSYQAEYAGNGGAVVEVVTKSGGKEFHGSGYYYGRNEALNANDFFNNRNGVKRPTYRHNLAGFTLGGPIYVPGKWNRSRERLFGFYNLEQISIRNPGALTQYTMPSALERQGDFSQTLDTNGRVIQINDPTTGRAFPNNMIPKARLNASGLALLNTLPLPNFENRAITGGNYNYQIQEVLRQPKRSQLFKIDYVPTDKDRFYVRGKTWLAELQGYAVASGATPIGFFGQCYCFTESGLGAGWTHIFTPNLVMEVTSGARHNREAWHPYGSANEINKVLRSGIGYTLGQWFPQSNPEGIIPRFSFGGVLNPPNVSFDDRFLKGGTDFTFSFGDHVTYTRTAHTFKAGLDLYRLREYEGERSIFSGTFAFARDTLNPLDTNYAFSNAALGVFQTYTESNARYGANEREGIAEWFLQDTWKAHKRLTIDYGIRFTWYNQMYPHVNGQQSVLALDRYNASDVPPLFKPVVVNGVRQAQNPVTGQLFPAIYVGAFVPGVGNPAPGGVLAGDKNYPRGFVEQQPVLWGPRLGFAFDPFGNGKTAIRAGGAILYNYRLTKWSQTTNNPPAIFSPITYYGDMNTFLQTAGLFSPSNTNAYNRYNKTPVNYNMSFGLQQDMGHSILLDVSYLAVLGRHVPQTVALNTIPYGARNLAQNTDPTNGRPLPDNFFRPFPGYNNITLTNNAFSSNYNALLLSINRRFSSNLQFGISYTYSKFMDYTGISVYRPLRIWSYGLDGSDQTHNLTVNYSYALPKVSRLAHNNAVLKWMFDDWRLSGIGQWVSGTPGAISLTTTDGTDLTGGGDGQRVNVVGDAKAGGSTFSQWFNTAAFARPGRNDPGNAGKFSIRNPGVNNIDTSISKRFPLGSNEQRSLQLRWEAYNTFNHTQYSGLNLTARFDPAGVQTNSLFGSVTSTRTPRVMQGSLRFTF